MPPITGGQSGLAAPPGIEGPPDIEVPEIDLAKTGVSESEVTLLKKPYSKEEYSDALQSILES